MYFTLLVVVILTAIALVAVALGIARAISPRSYNPQKGEAYECGIPTRGRSWMQFKVGYYLFAILFLMFDWFWALHTHGGKELWNGNKEAGDKGNEIRGFQ